MSTRNTKVPLPYTATKPSPGAAPATSVVGNSYGDWVKADIAWKESQPQPDYTTGSGSGINNG